MEELFANKKYKEAETIEGKADRLRRRKERKIQDYEETLTIFSQNQFFSTTDPVKLFQALEKSLNTLKIFERQVDEKSFKINRFQVDVKKLKLKYKCLIEN